MTSLYDSKECPGNLTPADDYDGDYGQCSTCAQWVPMFLSGPRNGRVGFHFIPRSLKIVCLDCNLTQEPYSGWGLDIADKCTGTKHRWWTA